VNHALAKDVLTKLSSLRRSARTTTPYALLADAIAALHVRPQIQQRFKAGAERAVANVDLFLEMARAYDVRGCGAFASDMRANWEEAVRQVEGRPDAEQEAVSLITVHAAKGLEWPVVIPINMTGTAEVRIRPGAGSLEEFVLDPDPRQLPGGLCRHRGPRRGGATARARAAFGTWPRTRGTRPADPTQAFRRSIGQVLGPSSSDLGLTDLPPIKLEDIGAAKERRLSLQENGQTREIFAAESAAIFAGRKTVTWRRPSRSELDQVGEGEAKIESAEIPEATEIAPAAVLGSSTRGTILHKLIEEVLTGEAGDAQADLEARAADLIRQMGQEPAADPKTGICAAELASTVLRTLALPDVAVLRRGYSPNCRYSEANARRRGDYCSRGKRMRSRSTRPAPSTSWSTGRATWLQNRRASATTGSRSATTASRPRPSGRCWCL